MFTDARGFAGAEGGFTNQPAKPRTRADPARGDLSAALPPEEWKRVEAAVDRALAWLAEQQQPDGSFPTFASGQPAITSLCVLAFLSRGHQPGLGPYGKNINRAIDYVLKSQKPDGLLNRTPVELTFAQGAGSHTATYNHAIAALMLAEVYGSAPAEKGGVIKQTVEKALEFSTRIQREPAKRAEQDEGGWRYVTDFYRGRPRSATSDLSVSGWHLMFLRSAKNAGFNVPEEAVKAALGYVERCFDSRTGLFYYGLDASDHYSSRAMMGAGILSLSLGGKHQTDMAKRAGDWLLAHPFNEFNERVGGRGDRFFYAAYYCSQGMAQLGAQFWKGFFPPLVKTFLQHQSSNGAWTPEAGDDAMFGQTYSTALAVLSLTPPFQLLPIFQR
jgi:hypothetical protein